MSNQRQERIQLPPSHYGRSWLLYIFEHTGEQQAVWLHKIKAESEFIHGSGYTWQCSCGANDAGLAGPLTAGLLRSSARHGRTSTATSIPRRFPCMVHWRDSPAWSTGALVPWGTGARSRRTIRARGREDPRARTRATHGSCPRLRDVRGVF